MEGFGPRFQLSDLRYLALLALPMAMLLLLLELSDVMDEMRSPPPPPKREEGYQDLQALLRAQGMDLPPERVRVPGAPDGCSLVVVLPGDGSEPGSWALQGGAGTCEAGPGGWTFTLTDPGFRGTVRCAGAPEVVVGPPDEPVPDGVTVRAAGPDGADCEPPSAPTGG